MRHCHRSHRDCERLFSQNRMLASTAFDAWARANAAVMVRYGLAWDDLNGLPCLRCGPPRARGRHTGAAFQTSSKAILAHWDWWWGNKDATKPDAPVVFARQVSASALRNPPPTWNGLVIDLTGVPAASVPGLLEGLPKVTAAPGAAE